MTGGIGMILVVVAVAWIWPEIRKTGVKQDWPQKLWRDKIVRRRFVYGIR
jgi:hypothetical protein